MILILQCQSWSWLIPSIRAHCFFFFSNAVAFFLKRYLLWTDSISFFLFPFTISDGNCDEIPSKNEKCDGNPSQFSVTIFLPGAIPPLEIVTDFPSQFPSQIFFVTECFRHKKLWRTFVRHNFRHKLWRTRHNLICDEWNCDGVLSVTISVRN